MEEYQVKGKDGVSMKIVVLNGSPKGDAGVTIQYLYYIRKMIPEHQVLIHHVGHDIRKLEPGNEAFWRIIEDIRVSDAVIWAFPVYFLLVPSQYKRFIELVFERGAAAAFFGKYSASFSTSIHFFDHTAHNYIHAVSDDLGMQFAGFFSAGMEDAKDEKNQKLLMNFTRDVLSAVREQRPYQKVYPPLTWQPACWAPGMERYVHPSGGQNIVIVTDEPPGDSVLNRMIEYFRGCCSDTVPVYRLQDIDIRGGCLGCIRCGPDNTCSYSDGFAHFFSSVVAPADIIIMAGRIHDRYLSSAWKEFFDRSFFRGHVPSLEGAQIGFMIEGPLSGLPDLREVLCAYAENQHANPAFISDECQDPASLDQLICSFAGTLIRHARAGYIPPPTYLSVGGKKIFRDAVFGHLRFPFLADHAYYRRHGFYDFPQKEYCDRFRNFVMAFLMHIPAVRREYNKRSITDPGRQVAAMLGNPRTGEEHNT